jgi:hypothetical protein
MIDKKWAYELGRKVGREVKGGCWSCVYDGITDTLYYTIESEVEDEEKVKELYEKLLPDFLRGVSDGLKEKIRQEIEEDLREGNGAVTYVFGVQHVNLPHKYYHEYTVYGADTEGSAKEILEENGILPHAWGIAANYDNWGNYWWVSVTNENLEEVLEDKDFLVCLYNQDDVDYVYPE